MPNKPLHGLWLAFQPLELCQYSKNTKSDQDDDAFDIDDVNGGDGDHKNSNDKTLPKKGEGVKLWVLNFWTVS